MPNKKIAIIGAGPCGIMSAILLSKNPNFDITLFEQNDKIGKKILISGNGKCNITNKYISIDNYQGSNQNLIKNVLNKLSFQELKSHLETLGLYIHSKENGQSYPLSDSSASVVNVFMNALNKPNIKTILETKITNIKKNKTYELKDDNNKKYTFDNVILANGSNAYPVLGGNSSGYEIAKSFGHTIKNTMPSLVGIEANIEYLKLLSGFKQKSEIKLFVNNKLSKTMTADVLFTNYGLSGFGVFDITQYMDLKHKNHFEINLFPEIKKEEFKSMISNIIVINKDASFELTLSGVLHKKLIKMIIKKFNINSESKNKDIKEYLIDKIIDLLYRFRVDIDNTHGFKHSEVSNGGINSNEISNTLESLKSKGLYFGGEVLDVVGQRGGYNIHFAFASAFIISASIL
ncbi:MAG: NAD(FAD)-utilizing dehydrogenases [uncultured Campylobacterales bacterium]|uniref:NAD(FAD)-utilizing dehydrogenases n=1 Tax=uncultured Campylobacterales bacterium TaxID=352960 RepID=A0A6S6SCQ7_9BACT|nr:MAG: NAD(FAD)-utilizing dehydrogenases [uncultured Campylobacterales bacterium]